MLRLRFAERGQDHVALSAMMRLVVEERAKDAGHSGWVIAIGSVTGV
jgi:hypothetical protein